MDIKTIISGIKGADTEAIEAAKKRNDELLKPLGSLGRLEDIAIKMAGITGEVYNRPDKRCVVVMAADNGIVEEGVAGTPQEMTLWHISNIAEGYSGVGVLSSQAGSDIRVFDIGIKGNPDSTLVRNIKIKNGTDNFAKGPAMSRTECEAAILKGFEAVSELKAEGYQLLGTGEMGIGNTSSSAAVCMCLTGLSAELAVGRGGGLTDEGLVHKKEIIGGAVKLNSPDKNDPIDIIAKVGGLDIAGLTGVFLGAAYHRIPVVIDGVISAAAALCAVRLNPLARDFMFASHKSVEPAYMALMNELGLEPALELSMRLGEGTGCPLMFHIIASSCALLCDMHTFAQAKLDADYRIDNRKD